MKIIILHDGYPIEFEHRKYPEGQQDIIIKWEKCAGSTGSFKKYCKKGVKISSHFNNWQDLELIICATKALRNLGVKKIHLYCPYMLGARSDRKFQDGGTSYLRDVIAPVINSLNFTSVTVMDPHSDGVENTINNIIKLDNVKLVQGAIQAIAAGQMSNIKQYDYVLVSPDAGAQKKIYHVAEKLGAKNVLTASKHREISTGKILSTEVNIPESLKNHDIYVIDDICDGGRTFIELVKAIPKGIGNNIYLVATHGIFSAGLLELSKYFDKIFTTNSVKDIEADSYSDYTVEKGFVSQLNVF